MNKKITWIIIFLLGLGVGVGLYLLLKQSGGGGGGGGTTSLVQDMFKYPGCNYKLAGKYYYNKLQEQFDDATVKDIINGRGLTEEVANKQAAIASDAINKNCSEKVSIDYPFCCKSGKINSEASGGCIACNVLNNTRCDLLGKDNCTNTEGITYCKLKNNQCVYDENPIEKQINTKGCSKNNQGCFYKPPQKPPTPEPSYKWDCSHDLCYTDSIKYKSCDTMSNRQSEKCIIIPDHNVSYCATRANSMNAADGNINPKCLPYFQ